MIAVHHFLFYRTPPLDPGPKGFTVKQGEHTETFRLTIRFVTENFNDFQLSHRLVTPTDELKCKHSLIRSDPTRCFGPHRSHVSVLMSDIHTMRNKFSRELKVQFVEAAEQKLTSRTSVITDVLILID